MNQELEYLDLDPREINLIQEKQTTIAKIDKETHNNLMTNDVLGG